MVIEHRDLRNNGVSKLIDYHSGYNHAFASLEQQSQYLLELCLTIQASCRFVISRAQLAVIFARFKYFMSGHPPNPSVLNLFPEITQED